MSKPSNDIMIDAARLPVMLSSLRLPSFGQHWQGLLKPVSGLALLP